MKLNRSSQLVLVSAASVVAAGLITACATLTTDFVYVTSSKAAGANNYGEVDVFEVNSESGRMRQIPTSPFPSGGRDPVAEAISTDSKNLYVVNEDDNSIVQFAIGNDGKIYPQNTVNTPGIFPIALASEGSLLFVADTYQPLPICSPEEPCSGSVAVLPLSSTGTPGTAVNNTSAGINYWPMAAPCSATNVLTPSSINVAAQGKYLFVAAFDTTAAAANTALPVVPNPCDLSGAGSAPTGYVFAFAVGSGGVLTAVSGSPFVVAAHGSNGAGVQPSAIASDPSGDHVYVTDLNGGQVFGYTVSSGALSQLSGSPFAAGNGPAAITIDPSGSNAYAANSLDNTITAYSIDSGVLKSFGTYPVSQQPVAMLVDPATGNFVYAAGYLSGTISGFQLKSGGAPSLVVAQQSPFPSNAQPTAMVAITHGGTAAK